MKALGVYYWYVKIPQCGYVELRLEYITLSKISLIYKTTVEWR